MDGRDSIGDYALIKADDHTFYVVSLRNSPFLGQCEILCRDNCYIDLRLTLEWCQEQASQGRTISREDFI